MGPPADQAIIDVPSTKAVAGGDRSVLLGRVDGHRAVLARNAEGTTDDGATGD